MREHGTQRSHAGRAVELGVGQLRRAIVSHLGQKASGVIVAVYAAGVGVGGDLRKFTAEAQSEIAIGIMAVAIEESNHGADICSSGRAVRIGSQPGERST